MTNYDSSKIYIQYVESVLNHDIISNQYIYKACERFKSWFARDDIYFDYKEVDRNIKIVSKMKHSKGKTAGQPFILLPYQQWIFAGIFGWKNSNTHLRVTKNVLLFMARKSGKTALAAAIALVQMLTEDSGQQIVCCANSGSQARILFDMCKDYSESIDPNRLLFQRYRDSIKMPSKKSVIDVKNADADTLDGMSCSSFILDELHAAKDYELYNVLKSSQGFQRQPLAITITTAGNRLEGYPLFEMRKVCIDILNGIKEDDSQFAALYQIEDNDDWMTDSSCWIKANPSLGQTITMEFLQDQVNMCKNNPSLRFGVETKNMNRFCMSEDFWLQHQDLSDRMQEVDLEKYRGMYCYIGVDLASVSDLTAITALIPTDDGPIFKTYCFIPHDTFVKSPNHSLYERWKKYDCMIVTEGNVTDYDYIANKIVEINSICPVQAIYYDSWNSTQFAIHMTELGYDMQPYSQAIGNYNKPTREFERLVLSKKCIIDKSSVVLWCFANATLKYDHNDNAKPIKGNTKNGKIDCVISMLTALGGYLSNPQFSNEIWVA